MHSPSGPASSDLTSMAARRPRSRSASSSRSRSTGSGSTRSGARSTASSCRSACRTSSIRAPAGHALAILKIARGAHGDRRPADGRHDQRLHHEPLGTAQAVHRRSARTLDVVFLIGIAYSQTFVAVIAFVVLLQFSSNFAQGPFQGYIPDLVGAQQVALASALVGIMSVLGVVGGQTIASLGYRSDPPDFTIPLIAVGVVEFLTMVGTVLWVREGRKARDRAGRSWASVAAEAWGTDILRERSFVWLVASRLFFLMGVAIIYNLNVLYLERSLGLSDADKGFWVPVTSLIIGLAIIADVTPSGEAVRPDRPQGGHLRRVRSRSRRDGDPRGRTERPDRGGRDPVSRPSGRARSSPSTGPS